MSVTANRYQIRVRGRLDPSWSDRLWGMTIEAAAPEAAEELITTLTGVLPDQSALAGIVSALVDLHLTVISVQALSHQAPRTGSDPQQPRRSEGP